MMKDVDKEQADRIFRSFGSERVGGDGRRISLDEFRRLLDQNKAKSSKQK